MNTQSMVRKNASLSLAPAGKGAVAVSVQGQIKLIECDPDILNRVLEAVGDGAKADEIVGQFHNEFPPEEVIAFLDTLVGAGILTVVNHAAAVRPALGIAPLVLMGSGALADRLACALPQGTRRRPFGLPLESEQFPAGTVFLLCPDKTGFGALLEVNAWMLRHGHAFLVCFFDGELVAAGPSVIPGLTPCLGCYAEHRRQRLAKAVRSVFPWPSLENLAAAWPLPETQACCLAADWAGDLIAKELERLRQGGENPALTGRQMLLAAPSEAAPQVVEFSPISTCPACHALALDQLRVGRPDVVPPAQALYADTPVQYRVGGRRSLTNQETRALLDAALTRLGVEVSIRRHHDGPLDHMLYRYTASTQTVYDPQRRLMVPQQQSRGKGLTEEQAYFSAAFELFERLSARYSGGAPLIRAAYREVRDLAIDIPAHVGQVFHQGDMDRFDEEMPIDWVWGHSLFDGSARLVPASMVYLSNTRFQGQFYDTASGGLAAGGTCEDAVLQALLELIEHDAWMIWQASRVQRPRVVLDSNLPKGVEELLGRIREHGLRMIIRDYTTDFGFPVFRCWMIDDANYAFYASNGFGASLAPAIALERCISEAYQARDPGADRRITSYRNPIARDLVFQYHSLFALSHFKTLEMHEADGEGIAYSSFADQSGSSVSADLRTMLKHIRRVIPSAEVTAVNLTKEALAVPVVRVLAGGGVQKNAEPILSASERLFRLPVSMGYRKEPLAYEDLFNGIYPH